VIDRGWVPTGADASESVEVPAAPQGEIALVVRLRTAERASARPPTDGWVHAIAPEQVVTAAGEAAADSASDTDAALYTGVYGQRVSEDPAPAQVPGTLPPPDLDPGSHLSYAFQWWVFALGALVGLSWLARREILEERAGGPAVLVAGGTGGPGPAPDEVRGSTTTRPRRRKEGRAEAEEDALVDAQLGTPPDR
ncbi:MAG: SURF1 family protein, partial [Oxalobacteraceae bacterium]